ncbi:hypothetical protein M0D21_12360 [Aquimarina sp. D1M17]|uniref:hypothetical protein n=1 Tax=Aquimarina acroporae TaxID=2937283 RepID=UPI0020BF31C7|nr:hypothetical protein [Aquimarina acroporae]MCK8522370.1 hypothetical protein [Aquimarina acroporae]
MKKSSLRFFFIGITIFFSCKRESYTIGISSNKEEIADNGYRYTPSTQSFLRGHHILEDTDQIKIEIDKDLLADISFGLKDSQKDNLFFEAKNIPLRYLVPRLHYKFGSQPDDFDFFNLMMAEYSRNGLSFPYGHENDVFTHFETNLSAEMPWRLEDDYGFQPNTRFKPIRLSVVNNCLSPGLWELSASDKTGEMYHSWFNFPMDKYYEMTAKVNKLSYEDVKNALEWREGRTKIDLNRLRTLNSTSRSESISVIDEEISYSSQGSRRKLAKNFVVAKQEEGYRPPKKLSDVLENPVKMAEFIPPGIYSIKSKKDFDFKEYLSPKSVDINRVKPKTSFNFDLGQLKDDNLDYLELKINLEGGKSLIVGNLPLNLLVNQEDFTLHGFGVGILSASGLAERRKMLIDQGFCPSYAYLAEEKNGDLIALNSHNEGLEQVFIRSFPFAETPHWDVTFTSYERITDIVKYRIPIPNNLIEQQKKSTDNYITPVYFSYRDDNLR